MRNGRRRTGMYRMIAGVTGLMLVCCMMAVMTVWASETLTGDEGKEARRVYDMAGLFTPEQTEDFEHTIAEYQKDMKLDLVVVTTEEASGKTGQEYADDFYEAGGFGYGSSYDGVLFLIDMDHRELVLSTEGIAIRLLTDARIERILDDVYIGASKGDYGDSVHRFLEQVRSYYDAGIESGQYNYDTETGRISVYKSIRWYEALLALAVSAGVAGMACARVISQYGMEKERGRASDYLMAYRADCQFQYRNQQDNLINKFVSTRIIPRNHTGGGSSGSSAGRSSTHRSSSGRSHGGGSRKF